MVKGEYTDHYTFQRPQKPNACFMYQVFYILAEKKSMGDTSQATDLSANYICKIISRLENSMGVELFIRNSGYDSVRLTQFGRQLYEEIKPIQGILDKATAMMELGRQGIVDEPLRVAAPYALGTTLIHPFSQKIKQDYPDLCIDLNLLDYDRQGTAYNHDCAIVFHKPVRRNYCEAYLFSQEQGIYASKEYLEKNGEPTALGNIIASGDIIPINRHNLPNVRVPKWMKLFHNNYKDGRVITQNIQTVLDRILWHEGFGILQKEYTLAYPVQQVLQETCSGMPKEVYFIYPSEYKDNKAVQCLKEFLLEITKTLREG